MNNTCWIIAGATSTIAKQFSRTVAKKGHDLILLARDEEKLAAEAADLRIRYNINVDHLIFDATDFKSHESIVHRCAQLTNKPMNVLIAFGYMPIKDSLDCSIQDAIRTVEVNYAGAAIFALACMPVLIKQPSSQILVLGSVAGDRGRASNFIYGSAKAGLEQFCEGLRAALHGTKVSVTFMRLGYIDTPLTYGKPGYFLAASPEACAKACFLASNRHVSARYFPWFWRWIMLIFKWLPRPVFNRLKV